MRLSGGLVIGIIGGLAFMVKPNRAHACAVCTEHIV
jgi:hypothetical protein